jgi:hypothetical protein
MSAQILFYPVHQATDLMVKGVGIHMMILLFVFESEPRIKELGVAKSTVAKVNNLNVKDGEGGGRNIFKRSLSASNSSMKRNDSLGDTAARSAGQENRPRNRETNLTNYYFTNHNLY